MNNFTRVPKLPNFNSEYDDWLPYISRFEMKAGQNKWNEEEKFVVLSNLLTGECLQIWHSLQDKTYTALRDALFKWYKYTEEGFHERFRKTCPKEGDDFGNSVRVREGVESITPLCVCVCVCGADCERYGHLSCMRFRARLAGLEKGQGEKKRPAVEVILWSVLFIVALHWLYVMAIIY